MIYRILSFFFLLVIFGCSNNTIENQLRNYHYKFYPTPELSNGVKLILKREINPEFFGILYNINKTDKFYYGFINEYNDIIKIFILNRKESHSDFNNLNCLIKKKENELNIILDEELSCYSIFVGEVPFDGFSKIELKWNCSEKDVDTQELIDGKYYYFIKKGKDNTICNIALFDKQGQKINISYNSENGKWIKL